MIPRALVLALLLTVTSLAGCFSGDDDTAPATTNGEGTGTNTAAPTGRGQIVAFEETNATEEGSGGIDHHHDLWGGRDRVQIFEQGAKMRPMAARNAPTYVAQAVFSPVPGALVYEATERVEFTITDPEYHVCEGEDKVNGDYVCTDTFLGAPNVPDPPGGPSGLLLRFKHAATADWIDVGPIGWNAPVPIQITNPIQTDMPHATSSLWEFEIVSPNKQDQFLAFTAKAEIIRGADDIPMWPGHPDFYSESPSRVVLDRTGAKAGDPGLYGHGATIVPAEVGPVKADRLISYGTKTLYVWLNITDVQAPNPATAPNSWFFYHLNATNGENITDPFDTENAGFDVRSFTYVLPVDDGGMDSPYSDSSRWTFALGGSLTTPLIACYADCANWAATYDLKIIATNQALAYEDYTWHCLVDEECPPPPASG